MSTGGLAQPEWSPCTPNAKSQAYPGGSPGQRHLRLEGSGGRQDEADGVQAEGEAAATDSRGSAQGKG